MININDTTTEEGARENLHNKKVQKFKPIRFKPQNAKIRLSGSVERFIDSIVDI